MGPLKGKGQDRRGCQLEGVLEGGAIASRRDIIREVTGEGACNKSPVHLKVECFIAAARN